MINPPRRKPYGLKQKLLIGGAVLAGLAIAVTRTIVEKGRFAPTDWIAMAVTLLIVLVAVTAVIRWANREESN